MTKAAGKGRFAAGVMLSLLLTPWGDPTAAMLFRARKLYGRNRPLPNARKRLVRADLPGTIEAYLGFPEVLRDDAARILETRRAAGASPAERLSVLDTFLHAYLSTIPEDLEWMHESWAAGESRWLEFARTRVSLARTEGRERLETCDALHRAASAGDGAELLGRIRSLPRDHEDGGRCALEVYEATERLTAWRRGESREAAEARLARVREILLEAARVFPRSPILPAAALQVQGAWIGRGEGKGFPFLEALYEASGSSAAFFPLALAAFGERAKRARAADLLSLALDRIDKTDLPPLGAERLLLTVSRRFSRSDRTVSEAACERILEGWPSSPLAPAARLGLVRTALHGRNLDKALSRAEAMASDGKRRDALEIALFETGRSAVSYKEWEKALAALRAHAGLFPDSPMARESAILESRAHEAVGDIEGAAGCLEAMLDRGGLDVATATALLREAGKEPRRIALGAYLRAHGGIEKALRDDPPWGKGATGLCGNAVEEWECSVLRARLECLASLGRWEAYREDCRDMVRRGRGLSGPTSEFAIALVESYRQEGRLGDAAEDLQRIEEETGDAMSWGIGWQRSNDSLPEPLSARESRARNPAVREGFAYLEVALAEDDGNAFRLIEILTASWRNRLSANRAEIARPALVRLGPRAVGPLIEATNRALQAGQESDAAGILNLLAEIKDPRVEPFLRRLSETLPDGIVRRTAWGILGTRRLARERR